MSTLTAWAKGPRALIINDTAGLDADGIVRGWVTKLITVPHLRMAITTRGAVAALPHLATDLVAEFPTFDAVAEDVPGFLARAHDHLMMRLADQAGCGEIDLGIVGWSTARRQCEAYALSTLDHPGWPAFTVQRNDVFLAPTPPLTEMEAAGILAGGRILDRDPEGMLMVALELQRRQRLPLVGMFGDRAHHIVGGHAVLTEITEAGITQRIARTWPDRIGERINPGSPATVPPSQPATAGMPRAQRRTAEALARKDRARV